MKSSCGSVNITVWMHHMDANETHWDKARWELEKNAMSSFEQILEATPNETTTVRPLTFHFKNYPEQYKLDTAEEKQNKTKKKKTNSMDPYTCMSQSWPTSKKLFTSALYGIRM